jgi:hypothetical protein
MHFKNHLADLIQELKRLDSDANIANPSYRYLIDELGSLSLENIRTQTDALLYFLVDSYDGEIAIRNKIAEFPHPK